MEKEEKRTFPIPGFFFNVILSEAGTSTPADQVEVTESKTIKGIGFSEVSGISTEVTTEELIEGGENRFKHRLPSVINHPPLVLKRGVMDPDSDFATWVSESFIDGVPTHITLKDITVQLLNEQHNALLSWRFINAYPIKYEVSGLKADSNQLAIETIELSYQYKI